MVVIRVSHSEILQEVSYYRKLLNAFPCSSGSPVESHELFDLSIGSYPAPGTALCCRGTSELKLWQPRNSKSHHLLVTIDVCMVSRQPIHAQESVELKELDNSQVNG